MTLIRFATLLSPPSSTRMSSASPTSESGQWPYASQANTATSRLYHVSPQFPPSQNLPPFQSPEWNSARVFGQVLSHQQSHQEMQRFERHRKIDDLEYDADSSTLTTSRLTPRSSTFRSDNSPFETRHDAHYDELERDEDEEDCSDHEDGRLATETQQPLTAEEIRVRARKLKRFRLTHQQTRFLMNEFAHQAHPDAAHRERLAREIPGLSTRQVQVWFQNRRAKLKRLTVDDRERTMQSRALPPDFDASQTLRTSTFERAVGSESSAEASTTGHYRSIAQPPLPRLQSAYALPNRASVETTRSETGFISSTNTSASLRHPPAIESPDTFRDKSISERASTPPTVGSMQTLMAHTTWTGKHGDFYGGAAMHSLSTKFHETSKVSSAGYRSATFPDMQSASPGGRYMEQPRTFSLSRTVSGVVGFDPQHSTSRTFPPLDSNFTSTPYQAIFGTEMTITDHNYTHESSSTNRQFLSTDSPSYVPNLGAPTGYAQGYSNVVSLHEPNVNTRPPYTSYDASSSTYYPTLGR